MEIKIENNNKDNIINKLKEISRTALFDIGAIASGDIIETINNEGLVDTGLLKNSITFALSGESAQTSTYKADSAKIINGKAVVESGSYIGSAPQDDNVTVYIGTNVEYAKYLQYGTSRNIKPTDFMFAPLKANLGHYKDILAKYIKQE